jgi:hypothetical protein
MQCPLLRRCWGVSGHQPASRGWIEENLRAYCAGWRAQRDAVAEYLNGGKWSLVKEFVEVESGKRTDRPMLDEAIKACRVYGAKLVTGLPAFRLRAVANGRQQELQDLRERQRRQQEREQAKFLPPPDIEDCVNKLPL